VVNILLLEFIDIAFGYYMGTVCGLAFMMIFLYWIKHNKDSTILFDKKYLVPFLITLIIAVVQLVLEIYGMPLPVTFASPLEAFYYAFMFYAGVQEALKALLKWNKIDFFNT